MKFVIGIVSIFLFVFLPAAAQEETKPSSASIETHSLTSKVFGNTRTIRVLLPPGYADEKNRERSYPVLYLNDGVMVFRRFNLEETVHGLISSRSIEPLIIVGIDNGASTDKTTNPTIDRAAEFLPYPDGGFAPERIYKPEPPNPNGKKYPAFLEEVIALVKQKYRTKAGAGNTGIGGFSYGGVAALYTLAKNPDVFGKLLLESTPLWIGSDRQLIKDAQQVKKWSARTYIGLGASETPDEIVNQKGRALQNELVESIRKTLPETMLKVAIENDAKHEPAAWSRRFPAALQFLFGGERQSEGETVKLAPGGAVTIDGAIDATEWKDAAVFDLKGGGKVFFKTDGEFLFAGVRGTQKGWSHLYISQGESRDVAVMHASAALGMSVYKAGKNNLWQPAGPFAWDLRDRTITAETKQKMTDYLAKNSWVANNSNMSGTMEIEFQVKPRVDSGKTLYVAVLYAADAKNPLYFPDGLKDDTLKEQMVYGSTPNDLKFDPRGWAKIILEKKKTK